MATWERAGPPSPIYISIMVEGNGSENRTAVAAAEAVGKLADEVRAKLQAGWTSGRPHVLCSGSDSLAAVPRCPYW